MSNTATGEPVAMDDRENIFRRCAWVAIQL